ncbi:MAG: protein translocase subunit SecD [Actinobacteria bacterium]|nr:protein translocase subunit SecD [Actinomycetota bacterium]
MRRLRGYGSLVIIVLVAASALLYTLVAGNKPLLGLDLQGGVSVVLKPVQQVDNDTIDQAITIIRQRIDAIGVAEPEITRQGSNILIQIPGVKDKERALQLVGQTAELQFRPVLANVPIDPQSATTTTSGDPAATTTTAAGATTTTIDSTKTVGGLSLDVCTAGLTAEEINATGQAVLPQCKDGLLVGSYAVGPVSLTGSALETARANLGNTGQWVVAPTFKSGSDGIGGFNAVAGQCFSKGSTCPTGQLAIVLDGRVLSAPSINSQSFKADQIEISGSFTERTAKDLATALKYGALPVEFEQQQAQVVSATLGRDALHAGLVAGLVGLIAVAIYMMAFYRVLGLFAILKLGIEAALLWSIISWLGANNGLALTLAGITGIIVSIGVSLDSNVVYYEHLKEDINHSRSIRSSTDKSFVSAFSTIVKADVASLIGAALLWWLTVGPVRGFAFYLGLSTALDLLTSWAYMRPAVKLATRAKALLC